MSEAISYNQPRDFTELKDDAQIMVRQGGLLGTVDPSEIAARIASGEVQRGVGSYTTGAGSVTFPEAFAAAPTVIITANGAAHIVATDNITTTGFDIIATDNAGANATGSIDWIAIG